MEFFENITGNTPYAYQAKVMELIFVSEEQ